jgi:RecB family exonuclease
LKYVCGARTSDDQARELDPLNFGTLAHAVLEDYGRCEEMSEELEHAAIAEYLNGRLEEQALVLYGARRRSTIQLQLLQMRHRLAHFSQRQASLMNHGWRIHAVEWEPPGDSVELNFNDTIFRLQGKIDRIDFNAETDCWRIYDYKSGDSARETGKVLKRNGQWVDVQLALYHHLALSVVGGRPSAGSSASVQVGYFNLPKSKKGDPVNFAKWDSTAMLGLEEQVAEAVNGIRENDFFASDQKPPRDKRLAVLAGVGLLAPASFGADGEDEEEGA